VLQNRTVRYKMAFVNRLDRTVRFCNTGFLPKTPDFINFSPGLFDFATLLRFATLHRFATAKSYTVAFCNTRRCRVFEHCSILQRATLLGIAAAFLSTAAAAAAAALLCITAWRVCNAAAAASIAAAAAAAFAAAAAAVGWTAVAAAAFASRGRCRRRSCGSSEGIGTHRRAVYEADFRPSGQNSGSAATLTPFAPLLGSRRGGQLVEWDWIRDPSRGSLCGFSIPSKRRGVPGHVRRAAVPSLR
jgi:hypothetical protein